MLVDYSAPGGAGDPSKEIKDTIKWMLEEYKATVKNITQKMLDDYKPPDDEDKTSTEGVQKILDAYGITGVCAPEQ